MKPVQRLRLGLIVCVLGLLTGLIGTTPVNASVPNDTTELSVTPISGTSLDQQSQPPRAASDVQPLWSARWCESQGSYTVCLYRGDNQSLWSAAASGPVGTLTVQLIGANGVVLASATKGFWEPHTATGWKTGGRMACIVGRFCASYIS